MKRILKIARNSTYFFLIYLVLSYIAISLYPLILESDADFPVIARLIYSFISSLILLIPSIFYVTRKTTGDYIDAVKIEELQISEHEMRDAITNWVFAKHGKPVMGDIEFNTTNTDGKISCIVNVIQD